MPALKPNPLVITLFGPMQVTIQDRPLPRLRSRKALSLLALLALRQGRSVEREWLATTLWPDSEEEQALGSLRTNLSELRQALGEQSERIQTPNRRALCLEREGVDVDVTAFDAAIKSKRPAALERAVALYRGPLLEDLSEEWIGQERAAREQDCLQALGTLADAALTSGDWATAIGHYRRALGLDAWWEAARRGLMQALAERGDPNEAIQVYREFIDLLRSDPKAVPGKETTALYNRLRAEARRLAAQPEGVPPAAPTVPAMTGRLAHPLNDLIGREDERVEVRMRLRRSRLVTLTGPGGIGKTRLSVAVASESVRDYADGACLVALEALTDGSQIPGQIASVLGLKEESSRSALQIVADHLRQKRLLLVLDNCEHVLEASAHVAGHLLGECPGLRILATSREALGIAGEAVWSVPTLSVPDPKHLPAGKTTLVRVAMGYEGVQLFVERAQAVHREFSLTASNALAAAEVCAQLDGIPLAIELAAARVRVLTVEQIATRLTDHLSLLTGGSRVAQSRQQTLRATLDWSYDLLTEPERLLLARLSAFAGGWGLEAAERVCTDESIAASDVLDCLTSLVDKSLVVFESSDDEQNGLASRYRFLETVRQYAAQRLKASAEAGRIGIRHQDYFVSLAGAGEPHLGGPEQSFWLSRLETDHDNIRLALSWHEADAKTSDESAEAWLRLCLSLRWFWGVRGYFTEGRQWLGRALGRSEHLPLSSLRVKALLAAGAMALQQGDCDVARTLLEQSLVLHRQMGNQRGIANALQNLGNVSLMQGDQKTAKALYEESLGIHRQREDRDNIAGMLVNLGCVARDEGRTEAARSSFEESLHLYQQVGDERGIAIALNGLGDLAFDAGDPGAARAFFEEALDLQRRLGDRMFMGLSLGNLAQIAVEEGDPTTARTLYEESLDLARQVGDLHGVAVALCGLGNLALDAGDLETARGQCRESLDAARQTGHQGTIAASLEGLAAVTVLEGDAARAGRIWGAACALRGKIKRPLSPRERKRQEAMIEKARAAAGEAAFSAAWDGGQAMSRENAVAYALREGGRR